MARSERLTRRLTDTFARRNPRTALRQWLPALALLLVGMASCTGPGSTGAPEEPIGAGSPGEVNEDDPRLKACIEAAGYDYEEVTPVWSSSSPPPEGSIYADPAFWQAWTGCLEEAGVIEPFSQARTERENRETLEYVECMRDRGWDMPDPHVWTGPEHPGLLTPRDPEPLPQDKESLNQYYRDTDDCGLPVYDENDNLLPIGG